VIRVNSFVASCLVLKAVKLRINHFRNTWQAFRFIQRYKHTQRANISAEIITCTALSIIYCFQLLLIRAYIYLYDLTEVVTINRTHYMLFYFVMLP